MKRSVFLLICLVLLLTGCGPEGTESLTTSPSTTAATGETTPETTAPTLPPEPVRFPEGLQQRADIPGMLVLDDGMVVFHTWTFSEETEESAVLMELFDPETESVIASRYLENTNFYPVQSLDGELFLVEDYENSCSYAVDYSLNKVQTLPMDNSYGYFKGDLTCRYHLSGSILCATNTATGETAPVPLKSDIRFSSLDSYDAEENILIATMYAAPYSGLCATVVIDLDTGEILAMSEALSMCGFSEEGISSTIYNMDGSVSVLYGEFGGTLSRVLGVPFDPMAFSYALNGSDYMLMNSYEGEFPSDAGIIRLCDEVSICYLDSGLFPQGLCDAAALPDGRIIGVYGTDAGCGICILDPALLEFEKLCDAEKTDLPLLDETVYEEYVSLLTPPALPEHLAEVREEAKALEEKYGITILMSSQCDLPALECDFPITTTDDPDWSDADEAAYIHDALLELENALALYPEGFFRQFRNIAGEAGFMVLLVEDIASENDAIGVAYPMGDWYPIAVDVTYGNMRKTYCHEIWHAMETKITSEDYSLLNDGSWEALNPEGFEYSYDTTSDYISETDWTYLDGWYGAESYFVDAYSRVNGKEDRARLMEYVMADEYYAEELMSCPALYEKMRILCQAVRQVFDTTGWENVHWERFHTPSE